MFSSATPAQVEPIVSFPRGTLCLTLYIYAGSTLTVDNLKTDIALYCKKQGLSETIAGEWGDVIDKLTRDEVRLYYSCFIEIQRLFQITTHLLLKRPKGRLGILNLYYKNHNGWLFSGDLKIYYPQC